MLFVSVQLHMIFQLYKLIAVFQKTAEPKTRLIEGKSAEERFVEPATSPLVGNEREPVEPEDSEFPLLGGFPTEMRVQQVNIMDIMFTRSFLNENTN